MRVGVGELGKEPQMTERLFRSVSAMLALVVALTMVTLAF
jgi:hypothetical protein